ncbi:unnamed protein product [Peniophora sp. CBMAI 1063]|nr:unnamed protein product [Peniophora sp. CBMAI 1063]
MRLTLEERRLEIDLIDADTGIILFTATSHPGRSSTEVTVTKRSESPQVQHTVVAKLCFRNMFPHTIELLGEETAKLKAKDYVRPEGQGRWEITSAAGDVHTWSEANYKDLKLQSASGLELAHLRAPQHGDEHPTPYFTLRIEDSAASVDLERIVVSCLYLKHALKKTAQVGQQMGAAMANPVGNVGRLG